MPTFTFTADSSTDQITTSAPHGLVTGDPFVVRNVGGALPTASPALNPVTDYFAIFVDATHVRIAVSAANAFTNTFIDITAVGSGTHNIEFGIPYTRARTYAPGTQVKSVDLNALMDEDSAVYRLLTGQAQSIWTSITSAISFVANGLITANAGLTAGANQHVTVSGNGLFKHGLTTINIPTIAPGLIGAAPNAGVNFNNQALYCPIHSVPVGARIVNIRAKVQDSAAAVTFRMMVKTMSGLTTPSYNNQGGSAVSSASTTIQLLSVNGINYTVAAFTEMVLLVAGGGAGVNTLYEMELDYDQP